MGRSFQQNRFVAALAWTIALASMGLAGTSAAREPASSSAASSVSEELRARAREAASDARIRAIVWLEGAPARRLGREARSAEAAALQALDERLRAELERQAIPDEAIPSARDADRHAAMLQRMQADRAALRELVEERDRIASRVQREQAEALRRTLAPLHARVARALRREGAQVERALVVANALIVRLPADRLDAAARIAGVRRLSGDVLEIGHLTTADDATLASVPGSLWAAGATGGTFDPAIIDSGVDLMNPLMNDAPGRVNFWAVSLAAAQADANWADGLDEDDRQGHGTHVQGIVSSHGSPGFPTHLGLAYGVEKVVQLKAGFCCTLGGNTAMYATDRMTAVDLALVTPASLDSASGTGLFQDDIDGMNISYGGPTVVDDTDAARFVDAVIDGFEDLPITISAGNDGPVATSINSPGNAYNAITVANVDDQGTATRSDDVIAPTSSRGPTEGGRRKPDLSAPGTAITAPNFAWETQVDVVARSGTSMAAPMVLGVLMDLMDAGVTDELALKALLINTAQKNDTALDFESDPDGWDEAYGWGYMNALAAYQHRSDVHLGTLEADGQPQDYVLYAGTMQDEGASGEGRDRATLVWNRHADYDADNAPSTYFPLSDLDLRLYDEASGALIGEDANAIDNVHQVRIGSAAAPTPVVIRVDTTSAPFPSGDATEAFALATEEGFGEVALPDTFPATANWPFATPVEPGEQFMVEFWVRNDDAVASHANLFDLILPPGFTLDGGTDPFDAGSIAGGATDSAHAVWMITAAGPDGPATIGVDHTHTSYLEPWGPGHWNLGITVATDTTPPTPAVMSFAVAPTELSDTQLVMQAVTASDSHPPVAYFFDFVSSPSGGTGGLDSSWQTQVTYVNSDLEPNHEYCYAVRARDAAQIPNENTPSPTDCDYTSIEEPAGVEFGAITATSIEARSLTAHSNLGLDSSGVRVSNATAGTDSGWLGTGAFWTSTPLAPNTPQTFVVRARNGDAAETGDSPPAVRHTLAALPAVGGIGAITDQSIEVLFGPGANPVGTQIQAENTTTATLSPWTTAGSWVQSGLAPNSSHAFVIRARNGDGLPTADVAAGSATTHASVPSAGSIGAITLAGATAFWSPNGNPLGTEFLVENTVTMTDSGWITTTSHPEGGLAPNTAYDLRVRARNSVGVETDWLDLPTFHTLADDPVAAPFGLRTHFSIEASFGAGANPAGTEYLVENETTEESSGWITTTSWSSGGLTASTEYAFRVKARNGDGVETGWVSLGTEATLAAPALPLLSHWARGALVGALLVGLRWARRWRADGVHDGER